MLSSFCAVIVTYNRLEKLKKTLESYSNQILLPKYVIVVNNASTDGTGEYLNDWQKNEEPFQKFVITAPENLGGSGGFYLGQKKALELDVDWIMVADDDAYPNEDYLLGMQQYLNCHDTTKISVICGKVIQENSFLNGHRAYIKNKWSLNFYENMPADVYLKQEFNPDLVSYVGILLNKTKLIQVGLVNKNYFIWQDDHEHSCRLNNVGKIVCLPAYDIVHDCVEDHFDLSWKTYYGYRNRIDLIKQHFAFYFPFSVFLFLLKTLLCPVKGRTMTEVKLRLTAIKDGILGNLGKHPLYKPGWKP